MLLTRFLFEFGFPWLMLLQATRSNNSSVLDFMWIYCLPWFRSTDKTQYAPMCVHVTFFNELMSNEVREIWRQYRTASLMGNPGRNVAWDYVLERTNLNFKLGLHGVVTRKRLEDLATMMNGFNHVDIRMAQSWGVEHPDDAPSQYSHVLPADVAGLVKQLEELLGKDRQEVAAKSRIANPFGSGPMPWNKVDQAKVGLDDFIRQHLDGLRTDEAYAP